MTSPHPLSESLPRAAYRLAGLSTPARCRHLDPGVPTSRCLDWLGRAKVPDAHRLGDRGDGWRVAQSTLMNERVAIGGGAAARESAAMGVLARAWRTRPELRTAGLHDELLRLWVAWEVNRLTNERIRQRTQVRADGSRLSGRVTSVVDAAVADLLVVPAVGPDGPGLYLVDVDDSTARTRRRTSLDLTRPLADVTLDDAVGRRVAQGWRAEDALDTAIVTGAALLASEQVGLAQWCLDTTVAYVKTRAAVRAAGRQLPGGQAPAGRALGLDRLGKGRRALRRRLPSGAQPRPSGRDRPCPGALLRGRRPRRRGMRAAARRHRLHLGASRAPLPQARQDLPARAGRSGPAPAHAGHPGRLTRTSVSGFARYPVGSGEESGVPPEHALVLLVVELG